ncbi:hypothetical protein V6Z11_D09G053200 [Gossypium hirsutum]
MLFGSAGQSSEKASPPRWSAENQLEISAVMEISAGDFNCCFLFAKLPEAYFFLNPIVDFMLVIYVLFFLLAFVWQAAESFR